MTPASAAHSFRGSYSGAGSGNLASGDPSRHGKPIRCTPSSAVEPYFSEVLVPQALGPAIRSGVAADSETSMSLSGKRRGVRRRGPTIRRTSMSLSGKRRGVHRCGPTIVGECPGA